MYRPIICFFALLISSNTDLFSGAGNSRSIAHEPSASAQNQQGADQGKGNQEETGESSDSKKIDNLSGKLVVTNGEGMEIDYGNAVLNLSEKFIVELPKQIPGNFQQMNDEQKRDWYTKFLETAEGKAYKEAQQKRFADRFQQSITVNSSGKFRLKDVPPGDYEIVGYIEGKKDSKTYAGQIFLSVKLDEGIEEIDLEDIEVLLLPQLKAGDEAPVIALKQFDGTDLKLSDLRNKYVLIDFWGTEFDTCLQATPMLKKVYDQFATKGGKLEILSVALDEKPETANEYAVNNEMKWRHVHAPKALENEIVQAYGVDSFPSFWLIDPQGKIVLTPNDFFAVDLDVEKLLTEHVK